MLLYLILLVILLPASARQKGDSLINGQVLDADTRQVLPGATIRYRTATYTTHTGPDGRFTINASATGDSLSVSYVGYIPSIIALKNSRMTAPLTVLLSPARTGLQEVVVSTGYQSLPKERATGSFEKADQHLLNRSTGEDLLSRLEGTTTVLFDNRNKDRQLLVRGRSTLFGNNAPLVVVDNFPFDGDLGQLNPNDIESVTLLKDAAAASIWGARAGNGVLVITTRKGRFSQPLRVEASSNITIIEKPDLFRDNAMSSADFIDVETQLFQKGFYNNDINNTLEHPPLSPVVEILQKEKSGLLSHDQAASQIAALRNNDIRNDFRKFLYRTAISQQHAVSLSGGTPFINYFLSAGYDDQQSSLTRNGTKRITLRSDNTFKPSERLELRLGLIYTYSRTAANNPGQEMIIPGGGKTRYYPYASLADKDGAPLALVKDYRTTFTDTAGRGLLQDWKYYPLQELQQMDNKYDLHTYRLNLGAKYHIVPSLTAEVSYQYERQAGAMWNLYNSGTYYARNLVNLFTQVKDGQAGYGIPKGGILDMANDDLLTHTGRGQLNYNRTWNNRHELVALAGMEIKQSRSRYNSNRTYGYDPALLTFGNVDYVSYLPTFQNLKGNQQVYNPQDFTDRLYRFVSYYANATYTYDNRYILSLSARKDASNLFGVKSNQKGVPLWSAGLRWNISQENFFKTTWLPMLAARITYGYSGNTNNRLSALTIMSYGAAGSNFYINEPFATISTPPNPGLRWEKTAMFNMGLDFRFKKDILSGSIEFYLKKSTDLVGNTPVDPTTGVSTMDKNSAAIKGHGLDVSLHSTIINRKIKVEANLLLSYNTNSITQYNYKYNRASSYINNGINPLEGKPTDAILSYRWEGLDNEGNPQGWLNGKVSKDYAGIRSKSLLSDLVYSGRSLPPVYGAFRPTISYGRWSLSANILFKLGHYFRRNSINYSALFQTWNGHSDYARRWMQPGDEKNTSVPSIMYPANSYRDEFYLQSAALVEKAGIIRWKDISLQYTIPAASGKKSFFGQVQCFLYLDNIGTLYRANANHLDPEYGAAIPPRSASIGIRTSF
ncbi:SusC/RagA family TonB-linked outer membrane protein [Chitinophaga eiseniae]|uniref:SusC/RagA family TonB-linked outer membrane protein n=1 Tax=Chitinophaga eiseniae TaxID=634771 RepID=UPI001F2A6AAA|nr:SusC/RagA family TonB-linked outer membrane protein [Chitinophaga eiseniae]